MRKRILAVFVLSIVLVPVSAAYAFDKGDVQVWNTDGLEFKATDKITLKVEEEFRIGDDINDLYYVHTDAGAAIKAGDNFTFGVNYRQVSEKKNGDWREEYRPHFNATIKGVWKWVEISDRSRMELRVWREKDTKWRYRNKLTLRSIDNWTELKLRPYVADEIFVDMYGDKLNKNRVYTGITATLFEHLKTDIYYMWESDKVSGDKWSWFSVIGVSLKYAF